MDWYQCLSQRDLGFQKKWRASQISGNPGISDENAGNFGEFWEWSLFSSGGCNHRFYSYLGRIPNFFMKRWIFMTFSGWIGELFKTVKFQRSNFSKTAAKLKTLYLNKTIFKGKLSMWLCISIYIHIHIVYRFIYIYMYIYTNLYLYHIHIQICT